MKTRHVGGDAICNEWHGDLRGGVCFEGDAMTLGQLLRAADSGSGGTKLLGSDGGLRLGVRDSGAAVHVRVKYGNSAHDRDIKYEYQATVLDTDAFASARRSTHSPPAGTHSEGTSRRRSAASW